MTYQPATISDDLSTLPQLPAWVTSGRAETVEDVAFSSGAALGHLHLVLRHEDVPQTLLRARLALGGGGGLRDASGTPRKSVGAA